MKIFARNIKGIMIIAFIFILSACSTNSGQVTSGNNVINNNEVPLIIDASKLSRISVSKVKEIMGEPESTEKWKFNSKYDASTLTYDKGNTELMVIDDAVVRLTIYPVDLEIEDKKDIFKALNITPGESLKKASDTGTATKYHLVSDNIAELYLQSDFADKNIITDITVTYDLRYFE